MIGSFKIGSVLGIQVRVHWLFVALVLFLVYWSGRSQGQDPLSTLLWLGVLFGVVFLHELGHSLMARRFGIRVLDITFWPLGGMARMSEIPESARVEGLIAIAGPAVNFCLAALALPFFLGSALPWDGDAGGPLTTALATFLAINLMLGVFNLLPAFPMDGGRVLRAVLGRNGDWVGATERAVRVSRVLAVLMIAAGLFWRGQGLLFLPLIGIFVWYAGSRELWSVRMRHGLAPLSGVAFGAPFARPQREVDALWTQPAQAAPTAHRTVPEEHDGGARRPAEGLQPPLLEKGGIGPSQVERLERFPGSLRGERPSEA